MRALNRNDAMVVADRGNLGGPRVIGSDGAGVIAEIGSGVTGHRIGEEVVILPSLHWGTGEHAASADFEILGYPTQGTHAEYVSLPAENIFAKPGGWSWAAAAALPLAGLTAWRALVTRGRLAKGERVLVTGASGGVATFLVQVPDPRLRSAAERDGAGHSPSAAPGRRHQRQITRAPDAVGHTHDRSPVVIPLELRDRWLDPDLADPGDIRGPSAVARRGEDWLPGSLARSQWARPPRSLTGFLARRQTSAA